jgi:serine/threonine protein phosphatase 1
MRALDQLGFDWEKDRLFIAGDLIDRGPESMMMVELLKHPRVFAVRGNHDHYASRYETMDIESWVRYGGTWFQLLTDAAKAYVSDELDRLPIAIEIETAGGELFGVVHADVPCNNWDDLRDQLYHKSVASHAMNSNARFLNQYAHWIYNVDQVFVGHNATIHPVTLGNVVHIDTYGWMPYGTFTFAKLVGPIPELISCTGDFQCPQS